MASIIQYLPNRLFVFSHLIRHIDFFLLNKTTTIFQSQNLEETVQQNRMLQFAESRECTVNHLLNPQGLVYFKLILRGGGGLIETGGLVEKGCLFNLAKTMILIPHNDLEYKVEKLKYKKSEVMQPIIKNKSEIPVGE